MVEKTLHSLICTTADRKYTLVNLKASRIEYDVTMCSFDEII